MLKSTDEKVLYREWKIDNPKAAIVLVHGLGGHSGRFFEMGPILADGGLNVYAIELAGFGETASAKGHIPTFRTYTGEMRSLIELVKRENAGKKVFVFGESMGGLVTLDFSIHHQEMIDGIILMSPAVKDKLPISLLRKIEIFANLILNPRHRFSAQFDAGVFTRDPEMIKRIDNDPVEVRQFTALFFFAIFRALLYVNMNPRRIRVPFLMQLAGHDNMVSAEAAEAYSKKMASKDKTVKWYPEMYHALYVDKDRQKVFRDLLEWVNARI